MVEREKPMRLSRSQMFDAMKRRDTRYDGVFFVGVKTTKIYCLPSCKAKLPLQKNVVFFLDEKAAATCDYRSCMRCKPDLFPDAGPLWMAECLKFLHENTNKRVLDSDLAEMAGVEVSTLRRSFRAALHKTPASYHREMRLERAAISLAGSKPVLQVSEEIGFESLSGFVDAFRKKFGVSPGSYAGR
jgi:methylphosphotriester-DNA--protein-cysteine methyltransferase